MDDRTVEKLLQHKLVVIVRKTYGEDLLKLGQAMYDGGIRFIEVTFDQADTHCLAKTAAAISLLKNALPEDMMIGAGTVLTEDQIHAAADAGGSFIISPNVSQRVIEETKRKGLVSIPGAMTPSEIIFAHECGADIVKLFPAGYLGLRYIKDILAPISHVKLMATGGVTEENLSQFLDAGMTGAGISGRLTDKKLVGEGKFDQLSKRAKAFVDIVNQRG